MPPRVPSRKTLERGSLGTRSFCLPTNFQPVSRRVFENTHFEFTDTSLVQKEYLRCLRMAVAEKEPLFKTGACRSPGACSCFSIDWRGDTKPSLHFWAAASSYTKWMVFTSYLGWGCICDGGKLVKHFTQWEGSLNTWYLLHLCIFQTSVHTSGCKRGKSCTQNHLKWIPVVLTRSVSEFRLIADLGWKPEIMPVASRDGHAL